MKLASKYLKVRQIKLMFKPKFIWCCLVIVCFYKTSILQIIYNYQSFFLWKLLGSFAYANIARTTSINVLFFLSKMPFYWNVYVIINSLMPSFWQYSKNSFDLYSPPWLNLSILIFWLVCLSTNVLNMRNLSNASHSVFMR